jgi:polyphosphate glucokinase
MHGVILTAANIDSSWIGVNAEMMLFDATGLPFHILNDADAAGIAEMRFGIGRERSKGVVLFLTIGTGIGSAIFIDGVLVPNTEFGHLEVRGKDAEHRASDAVRQGKKLDWDAWAERLQEVLTTYDKLLWPDLIIIGGGVSKEWRKFMPFLKLRVEVLPARLLNQAGIIGAALFASQPSGIGKPSNEAG